MNEDGAVAQLVEQRTENPCVGGSIPPHTTETLAEMLGFLFFIPAWLRCEPVKTAGSLLSKQNLLFSRFKFPLLQFVINKKLKPLLITFPVNLHQSIEQLKAQQNEKYFYQPGNIINEQQQLL